MAKAKVALGLPNWYMGNDNTCSDTYWNRVIDHLARMHNVRPAVVRRARQRRDLYRT